MSARIYTSDEIHAYAGRFDYKKRSDYFDDVAASMLRQGANAMVQRDYAAFNVCHLMKEMFEDISRSGASPEVIGRLSSWGVKIIAAAKGHGCGECEHFGNDCTSGDCDGNEDCAVCEKFLPKTHLKCRCGGDVVVRKSETGSGRYYAVCERCNTITDSSPTPYEAIKSFREILDQ